jgi:hypothetical protein
MDVGGIGGSFDSEYAFCAAYMAPITSLKGATSRLATGAGTDAEEEDSGAVMLVRRNKKNCVNGRVREVQEELLASGLVGRR